MTTWAPFAKSPYCASHTTRRRGSALVMPYSNPSTASSLSGLLTSSISAWPSARWFGGGEELIDDDLGAVREVPVLCFPHDEAPRIGARHAVLEPEHGQLAERAVDELDLGLALREMVRRRRGTDR